MKGEKGEADSEQAEDGRQTAGEHRKISVEREEGEAKVEAKIPAKALTPPLSFTRHPDST